MDEDAALALATAVETRMRAAVVPGVAVGILDGDIERTWGFGVTNVEHPLPVDADTVFEIASITKTMTATVAALLSGEGRLDLDAPVRQYIPAFRVADPVVSERVTVRDLFTHTAGWFGEYLAPAGHGDDALARALTLMADLEQTAPSGTFSYNNVSLVLAGRVIEVVTGLPYERAVGERLFEPLGMTRSAFRAEDVLYHRLAAGHTVRDGAPVLVRSRLGEGRGGAPVGGVRSTVRDLLRYARCHHDTAALEAMRVPRVPTGTGGSVGLAWFLEDRAGVRVASHGGATVAHMSLLVLVPARRAAVVILTNGANGARLCAEVAEWVLGRWLEIPPSAPATPLAVQPALAPYCGRYLAPLSDVELSAEEGSLVLRLTWKGAVAERPAPAPVRLTFTGPDTVCATVGEPPARGFHPRRRWRHRLFPLGQPRAPEGRPGRHRARTISARSRN